MPNPFALLTEDDSGDEGVLNQTASNSTSTLPPATTSAQNKDSAKKQPANSVRGRPDFPQRGGGRRYLNESAPAPPENEPTKRVSEGRDNRGRGNGGGRGPRGGRGGRGSGGNRVFDRHSQTGRTDSEKQEHQAWGGDEGKRELADENEGAQDARNDVSGIATPTTTDADKATRDEWAAPAETTSNESPAPATAGTTRFEEPEDNTKTYADYIAERSSEALTDKLGSLNLRKPNEGADDAQWKNAVPITKEDDENYFGVSKEAKNRKKQPKEGKTYLEVDARFPRPRRGGDRGDFRGVQREGRGGRGRGGRGRGGYDRSSGDNNSSAVNTEDKDAFPSLS